MWRFIARRLLQMVPVLLGTTFLIYALVFALPGDPIQALAGGKPVPASVLHALHKRYNLDDPLVVQYGKYLYGILFRGDFGETFTGQSVGSLIGQSWKVTAQLALVAWVFEMILGLTLGVLSALRKGKLTDTSVLVTTTMLLSIPVFVIGSLGQLVFGVKLHWFPAAGTDSGFPKSYLLPGLVLGSLSLAYIARLTRTSLIENLRADYVRTARAKGLTKRRIVVRHALRNSLIPVITFLGIDLGNLMAGAIVTEGIFNLPGLGQQVYQAIQIKQGPVVVGMTTLAVLVFLFANLVVDILYGFLDPRIRYE